MKTTRAPITRHLLNWYNENKRDMPWRETSDPYLIWVSEVILQQTRVAQGWDYYVRFTRRFPTVQALASASEEEVLMEWQGLGYYSRARNMHAAARDIMDRFSGEFPTRHTDILSLKGIYSLGYFVNRVQRTARSRGWQRVASDCPPLRDCRPHRRLERKEGSNRDCPLVVTSRQPGCL